jgi:ATP-dependent Clp protease protease subunit
VGPNIRFVNKGNKTGEIWLYDQVGEGWFGGMSAKTFVAEMQKLGKVDVINLHINSPGGSVFDGVAIYNSLKSHPARIEVDVDSVAASIASVIAMAGDEIRMAQNAMMMIHDPMGVAMGTAEEMRKTAELLDQIKGVIAGTYAKRTGMKDAEVMALMAEETWMSADEALDMGFADTVTEEQKIAACTGFDFSNFKRAPAQLTGGARPQDIPLRKSSSSRWTPGSKSIAIKPAP